jgi:hypothetical protein
MNNLNVNNASRMTPAAARLVLRNTRLSKVAALGKRGILLTALLLVSATTPAESHYFTKSNSPNKKSLWSSLPSFRRTKTETAKNVAAAAAAAAAARSAGWMGSLVLAGPVISQYKEVYAAIAICFLVGMILYARIKQKNVEKIRLIEAGRAANRAHYEAEREKNRQLIREQANRMSNLTVNVLQAVLKGADPTLARLAAPALALPVAPLALEPANARNAARNAARNVGNAVNNIARRAVRA